MNNPGMMFGGQRPLIMTRPFSPNPAPNFGFPHPFQAPRMAAPMSMPPFQAPGMAAPRQSMHANPYGGGMTGMGYGAYGMSPGGGSAYGDGGPPAPVGSAGAALESQPSPEERNVSRLLTASGVPNDDGRPRWPLGLRILAARDTDRLREQVDAAFAELARQVASGPVDAALAQEAGQAVKELRRLLRKDRAERLGMPLAVYQESERFLDKLDRAGQLLEAQRAAPGSEARPTAGADASAAPMASPIEVGLHDNYFQPGTLTVPVGSTVRWTNQGRHRHTVSSEDGSWGSGELGTRATYTHTFARPGTYSYHCILHPQEMRGAIIVR
jgi:plastocyanin